MSVFRRALDERQPDPDGRRWVFVPYDQLSHRIGPLAHEDPRDVGIVLVESRWKAARRPYHKQKLALVLANLRHFALEQAARGVAVRHVSGDAPYADLLEPVALELGPLRVMRPAERELRADLAPLLEAGALVEVAHEGWLTPRAWFDEAFDGGKTWRMDGFYRHVRRATGILMDGDDPEGGRFSFDAENRKPWKGRPKPAAPPTFEPDDVTREVADLVEKDLDRHPGALDLAHLPATHEDAQKLWRWAKRHCMEHFGPYEDAMSTRSSTLFHTRISALLNLHRLLPRQVVGDVCRMQIPLQSKEGFVRQVLGWREFVHHVHDATDGFRRLPGRRNPPVADTPGDAGFERWSGHAWKASPSPERLDGGARPSFLRAQAALPPAFWGAPSGLACLDRVVSDVWEEAWGHHITRLMVLSNLATLLEVTPRELTDWFWVAYADAYDWVVEPNVLGMGTFALGDLFTTKPYVSGANYIDRMSDYCGDCAFDPGRTCPVTRLYWSFLDRHREQLDGNPRLNMPLASLGKRSRGEKEIDRAVFERTRRTLREGRVLEPDAVDPEALG